MQIAHWLENFFGGCFIIKSSWDSVLSLWFLKHSYVHILVLILILSSGGLAYHELPMNVSISIIPLSFLGFFTCQFSSALQLIAFTLSFPLSSLLELASFTKPHLHLLLGSLHCAARFCIHFPGEFCWTQRTNLMFFICSSSSCLVDTSSFSWDGKRPQSFPAIVNKVYIQEIYIICHLWFISSPHSGDLPVISAAQYNYSKLQIRFLCKQEFPRGLSEFYSKL